MRIYFPIIVLACLMKPLIGLTQPATGYSLSIRKAESALVLDGKLDEPAWQKAAIADNFFQNYPYDTSFANRKSVVRTTFDAQYLYIGAILYQPREEYINTSLKRDFDRLANDFFAVNIDPFNDGINGFHFAVSPQNVQREGTIDNGSNISTDWDNKWYAAVKNTQTYWTVEMAIPFKTLRYNQSDHWRINFTRNAVVQNEFSTWVPVPRQLAVNHLAYTGLLVWEDEMPKPGLNVSLIPFATGRTQEDFEFELPAEYSWNAGMDAKIGITPSLNLDLTINPDFSQVEVDRQITNLSRFELFFPERRQFFLENEDLFSKFGFPDSRPFFSRRIGIASGIVRKRRKDGQLIAVRRSLNVPIIAGVRLSGKLNKDWRIGLLNMQTAQEESLGLDPANYSVAVLQRSIQKRSYVGAIFVNKENFRPDGSGGFEHDGGAYNRVAGLEYNYYSADGKWEAELFYHRSWSDDDNRDAQSAALFIGHFLRNWQIFLPVQYVGSNYRAAVGFVPRVGFLSTSPGVKHTLFPERPVFGLISYGIDLENNFTFDNQGEQLVDRSHSLDIFFELQGGSEFSMGVHSDFTHLFFPFDPTNSGGEQLPAGSEYTYSGVHAYYNSDLRRNLFFEVGTEFGAYFNGNRFAVDGSLSFRRQPVGILALSFAYNNIHLPTPYNSTDFWLIGPRAELSFSRSVFLSTFLQYNTQADNVNINTRLQWRFRPVSDIFLVYTDNYFSYSFFSDPTAKNRALVLKVTYWLNM